MNTCSACGKKFYGRYGAQYCSRICRQAAYRRRRKERNRGKKYNLTCQHCGKQFEVEKLESACKQKFCSPACRQAAYRQRTRERKQQTKESEG